MKPSKKAGGVTRFPKSLGRVSVVTIKSRTDWSRVDALTDETIDYRDIPATDIDFWQDAVKHTRMDSVPKRTSH